MNKQTSVKHKNNLIYCVILAALKTTFDQSQSSLFYCCNLPNLYDPIYVVYIKL